MSLRFCGYFDEPGVIGTISGVLLAVNRCNLKDWKSWPLLISGIFSFSLFFYVFIAMYVILFAPIKYKILSGIAVAVAMAYLVTGDSVVSDLILSRLEIGDDGTIVGDNRTRWFFDSFYENFLHSDKLWFGYGKGYASTEADPGGASYKHLIVDFGIVMSVLYLLAFTLFYMSFRLKFKDFLFVMMIFFAVMFQRPIIFSYVYLFLLIIPPIILKHNYNTSLCGDKRKKMKS